MKTKIFLKKKVPNKFKVLPEISKSFRQHKLMKAVSLLL